MKLNINTRSPALNLSIGGPSVLVQKKTATPAEQAQTIEPDRGYVLSRVTIEAIPSNYGRIRQTGGALSVY